MGELTPKSDQRAILGANTAELLGLENLDRVSILSPWQRLGAETYSSILNLTLDGGVAIRCIAKACAKITPAETMQDWLGRRRRLESFKVNVPKLFATSGAVIVEEYIPYTLKEAYSNLDGRGRVKMQERYKETLMRIGGAGFHPTSHTLHDVRSRGVDVVVIDFGEDLGGYIDNVVPSRSYNNVDVQFLSLVN